MTRVDAASVFIQKTEQMKEYIDQKLYYGGQAEKRSHQKRIEFLQTLENKTKDQKVKDDCQKALKMWKESSAGLLNTLNPDLCSTLQLLKNLKVASHLTDNIHRTVRLRLPHKKCKSRYPSAKKQ